jgi:uncharacterized membrane protein (UPF0127 family)
MEENLNKKDGVMRTALVVLVGVVVIFAVALVFAGKKSSLSTGADSNVAVGEPLKKAIVNISGSHLIASIADTPLARTNGLSNVRVIGPNEGKLFVFDSEDYHEFWMKDMNFSIDIIFINDKGTVVDFVENIAPETYPNSFKPKYPASKAIEVNAGWVKAQNIKIGDFVLLTELKQ